MKLKLSAVLLSSMFAQYVNAAVLATPQFDTDSYLFFGTNSQFDPQITLGESQRPGSGHFNFGVMTFDVSTLNTSDDKFLSLSAVAYSTLTPQPAGPPITTTSTTGQAVVQLIALGDSFANYQAAPDKVAWYDANVQSGSVSVIGTFNFTDQDTRHVDVSSVVNGWIADGSSNHGFALFSTSGNVELASMTHTSPALNPALVDAVPEPSALILSSLGSLLVIVRRRRFSLG